VSLDLVVEMECFISNIETLEEGVASFLHLCFVVDLQYPKGSGILCTLLQRLVAKLDEYGNRAKATKRDMLHKDDKGKAFKKAFDTYCRGVMI
jgi:hypothetical protein